MNCKIKSQKSEIKNRVRHHYREKRNLFVGKTAISKSEKICSFLSKLECLKNAELIAAFHPVKGEPDISPFIREKMRIGTKFCFPRYRISKKNYELVEIANFADDFVMGRFSIPEPKPELKALPLKKTKSIPWLIPGIVFDSNGGRIGHGKGSYDRLLKRSSGIRIGICFEIQITDSVPTENHDEYLNLIVTEKVIRNCKKRRSPI